MVRYEKEEGHIKIAWGYDRALCGYFFSVVDNRLKQPSEASEDVKRICRTVSEDGGGSYFDLNTYFAGGFGHQVSETTIFAFMRRYGIDPTRINVDDSKPTMDLPTGGETPELRLDPAYIKRRRARIQDAIERCLDDPCPICVPRIDRTITELSKDNSVPIVRVGLVPPPWLARTIFFFPHDAYPNGYKWLTGKITRRVVSRMNRRPNQSGDAVPSRAHPP
ncbi:hypothetical protein EDD21DRAFT_412175 [Dissophora ornata]|nr:hypothetical protein EDD21DRAFT_412175 [Dissophora ornata]